MNIHIELVVAIVDDLLEDSSDSTTICFLLVVERGQMRGSDSQPSLAGS